MFGGIMGNVGPKVYLDGDNFDTDVFIILSSPKEQVMGKVFVAQGARVGATNSPGWDYYQMNPPVPPRLAPGADPPIPPLTLPREDEETYGLKLIGFEVGSLFTIVNHGKIFGAGGKGMDGQYWGVDAQNFTHQPGGGGGGQGFNGGDAGIGQGPDNSDGTAGSDTAPGAGGANDPGGVPRTDYLGVDNFENVAGDASGFPLGGPTVGTRGTGAFVANFLCRGGHAIGSTADLRIETEYGQVLPGGPGGRAGGHLGNRWTPSIPVVGPSGVPITATKFREQFPEANPEGAGEAGGECGRFSGATTAGPGEVRRALYWSEFLAQGASYGSGMVFLETGGVGGLPVADPADRNRREVAYVFSPGLAVHTKQASDPLGVRPSRVPTVTVTHGDDRDNLKKDPPQWPDRFRGEIHDDYLRRAVYPWAGQTDATYDEI
jgi:hypothetical protein